MKNVLEVKNIALSVILESGALDCQLKKYISR